MDIGCGSSFVILKCKECNAGITCIDKKEENEWPVVG